MVNKRGGKKHKRGKKSIGDDNSKKKITFANDDQVYAIVLKRLGGSYILLKCSDGIERQGYIRGKFKKKVWFNQGDYVLCTLGEFGESNKCLIELKYSPDQVSSLKSKGKLTFDSDAKETGNIIFSDQIKTGYDDFFERGQQSTQTSTTSGFEEFEGTDLEGSDSPTDRFGFNNEKSNGKPNELDFDLL